MKRQKTVFSPQELFHVFISQSQVEGKTPLKTPSRDYSFGMEANKSWGNYESYRQAIFQGKKIWSYGSHYLLGELHNENKVLLINSERSSNTTQGHKADLFRAAKHLEVYYVPRVDDPKNPENVEHLRENLFNAFDRVLSKLSGFRQYNSEESYKDSLNYREFYRVYKSLESYVKAFKLKKEAVLDDDTKVLLEEIFLYMGEKERERDNKRAAKRLVEKQAELILREENLKKTFFKRIKGAIDWKRGGSLYGFSSLPTMLRIKGDTVETSHGAKVPLKAAITLNRLIQKGKEIKGIKIGHYTCTGYNSERVVIGCHEIALKEVNRVLGPYMTQLKLVTGA